MIRITKTCSTRKILRKRRSATVSLLFVLGLAAGLPLCNVAWMLFLLRNQLNTIQTIFKVALMAIPIIVILLLLFINVSWFCLFGRRVITDCADSLTLPKT